jgi:rod shape determining protein RodA
LVLIQPDLGSAVAICATLLFILFLAKPDWRWWLPIGLSITLFFIIGWSRILQPYQIDRLNSFLDPYQDPLGKGYNLIQAKLAIGAGGLLGRGFGLGRQTQLAFLPEKHTDFVFAAIAEELGFIGVFFTLALYFWLFWAMLKKIKATTDPSTYFFRIGLFSLLLIQTTVNIGMNLQLLPVVGIPLPFLSYGGSSLLSSLFALGLFLS